MAKKYRAGISWGAAKSELLTVFQRELGKPRERYLELMNNKDEILKILNHGAEKARAVASSNLKNLKKSMGKKFYV